MESSIENGGWTPGAAARGALEILIAVNTPITAKLIARTLERAGHLCRLTDWAEAMSPAATRLAVIELPMDATAPPPHVVALYDSLDGRNGDEVLGKPVDPDLLIRIVGDRLRTDAAPIALAPPKSGSAEVAAIERRAIDDLRRLGGDAFVQEVVGQFFRDAETIVSALAQHVQARDVHAFQEDAHALRSCAANIGAMSVYQLCLAWRQTSESQLAEDGASFIERLSAEVQRVRAAAELGEDGCPKL